MPNNSFKPNLLRYTKHMAEKACHVFGSTTQVGLTQALGRFPTASTLADMQTLTHRKELTMLRNKIGGIVLAAACSTMASGCATMVEPEPGKITLEEALSSVGRGLVQLKQAQLEQNGGKEFKSGLLPSEVEVTFNVTASGEQSGKLFVEITKTPVMKGGAEFGTAYAAARGNQITMRFRNVAFSKTTKLEDRVIIEGVTDPEMLIKVMKALEESGITVDIK